MLTCIGRASDLWQGEMVRVRAGQLHVVLLHVDDQIHAYEDRCCHQAVPLSEGRLEGHVLQCAAHHWRFDATTGQGINPKAARLRKFPVVIQGDDILIDLETPS